MCSPLFLFFFSACQLFLSVTIIILLFYYLVLTYSLLSYHLIFYLYAIWFDCCSPTLLSFSCHLRSLFHHFFPTLYISTFIFCFPFLKEYSTTLYSCLHLSFFPQIKSLHCGSTFMSAFCHLPFSSIACLYFIFTYCLPILIIWIIFVNICWYIFFVLWKIFMAMTSMVPFI